ncbi:MAG: hypothetical protein ABIZ70_10160 [Gemmatimonadales bacterium]
MKSRGLLGKLAEASAVVIAVASLAITLYEARATREHDRMSVWPRLVQESSDSGGRYDRAITNAGLGPALIKSFEVRLDDSVQTSWAPVVNALVSPAPNPGYFFSAVGPGTVILPGRTLHVLTIISAKLSTVAAGQDPRLVSRVCYCSLYDECWTAESRHLEPQAVEQCPVADTGGVLR